MKNHNMTNEEQLTKKWLIEAGNESPSKDFHLKILANIETKKSIIYQPLISSFALRLIGLGIITIFVLTILLLPGGTTSDSVWNEIPTFSDSLQMLSLPKLSLPKINMGFVFNTSLFAFSILMFFWMLYYSKKLKTE